ncbi:MAG TPA: HAD-IA family hydrolase [Longimicrobiales bacterium]
MPNPAMPHVVLLDLDGTLINTKRLYVECYRQAVLPYVGRELTREEILALRPRSELRFLSDVVGKSRLAACIEDFYRAYDRLYDAHAKGVYDGVPEMLAEARTAGARLGIVTGKSRRSWELTRARHELGPFDVLVFDDDVSEPKPDPEGLRLALDRLGAEPGQAVYLGDSGSDIEAAAAAGVQPAAALWAKKVEEHRPFLDRIAPHHALAFHAPGEFARWLRERIGASPATAAS